MRSAILMAILISSICASSSALTSEEISEQVAAKIREQTGIEPVCGITGEKAVALYKSANTKLEWVSIPVGKGGLVPIYSIENLTDIIGVTSIDQADAQNKNHPALSDAGAMISVEFNNEPLRLEFYAILMDQQSLSVIQFNPWNLKKIQRIVSEPIPDTCLPIN